MKYRLLALLFLLLMVTPATAQEEPIVPILFEQNNSSFLFGENQLSPIDHQNDEGKYYDVWAFSAEAGERIQLSAHSNDFDTVVAVLSHVDDEITLIDRNDDRDRGTTDSYLVFEVLYDSRLLVYVTSYLSEEQGRYRVELTSSEMTETELDVARARALQNVMGEYRWYDPLSPWLDPF